LKRETNNAKLIMQFRKLNQVYADLERLYPRIKERNAALSTLDISPRTFIHWKEQGLVWHVEADTEKRTWVRLNLYEYVWLRAVVVMREFGVPLERIKAFRERIEQPIFNIIQQDNSDWTQPLRSASDLTEEEIANFLKAIAYAKEQLKNFSLEDKQAISLFGSMINRIILLNEHVNLVIKRKDLDLDIDFVSDQDSPIDNEVWSSAPHLSIPLYPLVVEMINEPKNDRHIQEWGLINANERKVLEAMRTKDFRQILVKPSQGGDDLVIELTTDENLMGDQAKRLKTILGLDQYSEVTIKYRNDKNLFFRNTRKL
jgi:hypothetical protein